MPASDRRAPRKVRRFAVLERFRYMRRVYEPGDVFAPRGDVPRHRLDRLWRDGNIGTLEGGRCTAEKARPEEAAQQENQEPSPSQAAALEALAAAHGAGEAEDEPEAEEVEDKSEEEDEELPEYGEDHLD